MFVDVRRRIAAAAVALCCAAAIAATDTPEAITARRLAAIKGNPPLLQAFLHAMPKGGDLHNHLSGAIYAESYLQWAAEDGLCVSTATFGLVSGTCDASAGRPPASALLRNETLRNQVIDAMSMRNWDRAFNGHDHFFATFGKFGPSAGRTGDMLAEVTRRAASEQVSYLELMIASDGDVSMARGRAAGWDPDLGKLRDKLLAAGFKEAVLAEARQRIDAAESRQREVLKCGRPDADAGCRVTVRYLSQVLRAGPPEAVFAQILSGFELASVEPRIVSFNLVQPEDDAIAIRDFSLQMSMIDFLRPLYPRVPITLHADELAAGLVPPEAMRSHIRESIRQGHASRIGHGVSIMYEDDAMGLLSEMASKRVLVEIALSSNDLILGVRGRQHPLRTYLQYGVPVALATDDMGVSRSTHTQEFVKAVEEQDLDYRTLKALARNSLDYSFADTGTKAALKSSLEKAFRSFEADVARAAHGRSRR